jgi:hypothetical protein
MYCQRDLIKQSIAHLKLLLIDCASSFWKLVLRNKLLHG